MRPWFSCWMLVTLGCVLAACGSRPPVRLYEGPPRSAAQLAVLSMPEALEVASINGAPVKGLGGMLRGGDRVLELLPGRYELLIFYRDIWDQTGNHEVLRSSPALFVLEAQPGHRYVMDFERPRQYAEAAELADHFSGWIEDSANGRRVPSRDSGLKFAGGVLGGLTGSLALEPVKVETDRRAAAAAAAAAAVVPLPDPTPAAEGRPDGHYPSLMRVWWQQANAEERREFLRWLGEQPQ